MIISKGSMTKYSCLIAGLERKKYLSLIARNTQVPQLIYFVLSEAWAAAKRATGTRGPLQLT